MERAGDILKDILNDNKFKDGERYDNFFRSWERIVGRPLSDHTNVKDILGKMLLVEVDHPGWFQLFHFKEQDVLGRIKDLYPELEIRGIRVIINPTEMQEKRSTDFDKSSKGLKNGFLAKAEMRSKKEKNSERAAESDESPVLEGIGEDNKLITILEKLYTSVKKKYQQDDTDKEKA